MPRIFDAQQVSVTVGIYTLSAIGVDRYIAVVYPLQRRGIQHTSTITIAVIWITAVAMAVVQLFYVSTKEYPISEYNNLLICGERWPQDNAGIAYEFVIFIIAYCIPLIVLGYTYTQVIIRLWGRHIPGNADRIRDRTHQRSKKKRESGQPRVCMNVS
uniref:Neuropeptide Y receptor-like n=1 Tax=Saccoglossus kowalevskii TaxID=10224 RepID=A0ABM0MHY9_SACKO|nr:PREDICTED: neuropeptide Y receptor-like [Saccoglossus kowalevskii]